MIYFAQAAADGPVKIGYTANMPYRIKILKWEYGRPFCVLGIIAGNWSDEGIVQARFHALAVRMRSRLKASREWFEPKAELLEFIRIYSQPWCSERDLPRGQGLRDLLGVDMAEVSRDLSKIRAATTPNARRGLKMARREKAGPPPER